MLFDHCPDISFFKLTESEWAITHKIMEFFKNFKIVTKIVSSETKANLPTSVVAFNVLLDKIETLIFSLDGKVDRNR